MSSLFKVGLIGAGTFAGYHADKVRAHPRARLIGLFDPDRARAREIAGRADDGVRIAATVAELAAVSDAVIIASPASSHAASALIAIKAGCHLLVEKPLATQARDGRRIVEAAKAAGRVLQVGHQERIVAQAIGLDRLPRPLSISAKRMGPRSLRNLDANVVADLMIHDIDLVQWLCRGEPGEVTSKARTIYSSKPDWAEARFKIHGCAIHLVSSRDAEPLRTMNLIYEDGQVSVDFIARTLTHTTDFDLNTNFADQPEVKDSLAAAFDSFVRACLDGDPPLATGEEGLAAVRTAEKIRG